jgi:hypothetical protein
VLNTDQSNFLHILRTISKTTFYDMMSLYQMVQTTVMNIMLNIHLIKNGLDKICTILRDKHFTLYTHVTIAGHFLGENSHSS